MSFASLRRTSIGIALALALCAGTGEASAAGVAPARATPVQREQAQSRFVKGRDLYSAKKYDAALVELSASLDIVASPNTRLYVGRCLRDMGRLVAAYAELGRTAVEANELRAEDARYEKAAASATEERAKLLPRLAFVDVRITHAIDTTTLRFADESVRRGGWEEPVPAMPGDATLVVETPGHAPITHTVHLTAGEHAQVALDAGADLPLLVAGPPIEAPEPGPSNDRSFARPMAFAAGGVAVAGLVTFVVAGALANGSYSDLEKACGSGPCPAGHEGDISAGRAQQTLANVGLAVVAVAGAASVTLFILGAPKKSDRAAASARLTAGPSFVGLQGGFR